MTMSNAMHVISVTTAVMLLSCLAAGASSPAKDTKGCKGLASYQLTLKTLWSKETFETHYPLYRPAAQWSKLVGRSHSRRYSQWSHEKLASEALKEFSEQGLSTGFDFESQGSRGIYDSFVGPNISVGVGTSQVNFLAHPSYHKLSFVVRMIPSPDWFIGVDSVDLCAADGQWKSDLTLDLHPIDAGTDRGLTFTSPKWQEKPPKPITTITSKVPEHPASSFYYPDLDSLPPIATVQLTKVDFDWTDTAEEVKEQVVPVNKPLAASGQAMESEKTKRDVIVDRESTANKSVRNRTSSVKRQMRNGRTQMSRSRVVSEADTAADCEVSVWSEWSACSKTCGYGRRMRTRNVIRRPSNGGQPCPLVQEEQMCGSMYNCQRQKFTDFAYRSQSSSRGARPGV